MKKFFEKFLKKKKKYISSENEKDDVLSHYQILKLIHDLYTPKTYLEIGVQQGRSINLANKKTKAIGIDPFRDDKIIFNENVKMFHVKSDDFFENNHLDKELDNQKVDVSLIDGMHLFDFVLRDFINSEKNSGKNSLILIHDTIPIDKISSDREISSGAWTGDVYKIILILKKYRPELKIYNISIPPIGVCLVHNLNPDSDTLIKNYENIYNEYINMNYDDIKDDFDKNLSILRLNIQDVENILKHELKISF
ncbi:MAG: class I SAM-dependent methyltransferase [bacterium]